MNEEIVIPIAGMLMVIVLSIGVPLVIALGRKWQREADRPRVPDDTSARLQRIELAIEAMSIEVERISEGQRFTTRLLAERQGERQPAALPSKDQPIG